MYFDNITKEEHKAFMLAKGQSTMELDRMLGGDENG